MTVAVQTDLAAAEVRQLAKAAATPHQARRLLAIALVLEGADREDAARSTGMDRQTLRSIAARSTGAPLQHGWAGRLGRPQGPRPATALDPRSGFKTRPGSARRASRRARCGADGASALPMLGTARDQATATARSALPGRLSLRCRLSRDREDRRSRAAAGRHRGHEPASGRDRPPRRRRCPRRRHPRPGRLARRQRPDRAGEPDPPAAAALQPRAEPDRKPMA